MKKYILLSIFFIVLLFQTTVLLYARGKIKKQPIELTFWHSMSIYQGDALENLVAEYNETHKDILIKPTFQGLYNEVKTKLINSMNTGGFPDISQVAIEYLDVFIYDNKIDPITDIISEEDKKDILNQFWNGVTRNEKVYAFPFNQSVQVLYFNKDAFREAGLDPDKPPKTWNDLIEYGKILTKDFDNDGKIDQWGLMISLEGVFGFTPLIRQVGGEFLNEDKTKALFNGEEGVRVMKMLQDMEYKYKIMPLNWTLFEGTNAFLTGKIAMGPITCAGIKFAEENLPWELGITSLPYIENKSVLLGGAGIVIFTKSSYKRRAAMDFIHWLTNKENCVIWHEKTGYLPIRKSAIDSFELKTFHKLNPNYKIPIDQLPYSRPPDFNPYLPQIDQIIRFAVEDIMINKKDPKGPLNLAAEKVNELLRKEDNE